MSTPKLVDLAPRLGQHERGVERDRCNAGSQQEGRMTSSRAYRGRTNARELGRGAGAQN